MMEAKDKSILQQIQERYPGIDPDIDIDWEVGEIFFNTGEKQGIDKGRKEVVEFVEEHMCNLEEWTGWQEMKEEWGIEH